MCTVGATRAARACKRLGATDLAAVSVTAALFDMFCGLNGATFSPRVAKARREAGDDQRLADVGARALEH